MVSVIKEICIFIIVAQAILFFVPGKSYIKYVRILVGIIMILRITEPIFGLVMDEESQQKIRDRIRMLEENIDISDVEEKTKSSGAKIYESFEKELKNRLENCESNYEIVQVKFSEEIYLGKEDSGKEDIVITVSEKNADTEGKIRVERVTVGEQELDGFHKEEDLKELYGECIGIEAERIKIVLE